MDCLCITIIVIAVLTYWGYCKSLEHKQFMAELDNNDKDDEFTA